MPELPDLLYICSYLSANVTGHSIRDAEVQQPVVLRVAIDMPFEDVVIGKSINQVRIHGPFLVFELSDQVDVVLNLMLAGMIQHQRKGERAIGYRCVSLMLDDGSRVNVCDSERMAKFYVMSRGNPGVIPKFDSQGVSILSKEFNLDRFLQIAASNKRKQVRVFINDHTALSAIGNAYADEILHMARLHPKTFVAKLSRDELTQLYKAIVSILKWGTLEVERAHKPIHAKVRDHMRIRNRKGEPCAQCGTRIRREGVRGHDVFFCPKCQPASRKLFIDWNHPGPA